MTQIQFGAFQVVQGYIYPIILATAVIFLKDSTDPLQGLSKLNYYIIISINQRVTNKFKDLFINGDEFKVLDTQQRKVLLKYIDLNNSDVSSSEYLS